MSYFLLIAAVAGLMLAVKVAKFFGALFVLAVLAIVMIQKRKK
jgi:hypothetical protein